MQLSAKFNHIDRNFGFSDPDRGPWSVDFNDEDEFVLALNRMAIASSEHAVVEFPEVEVTGKNVRVTIQAISGQLYYTDLHSQNRKNLKVIPVEIVRLIQGKPLDEVFHRDEDAADEAYVPPPRPYQGRTSPVVKVAAVLLMCAVVAFSGLKIWRDFSYEPRLSAKPSFIPSLSEESEILRKYADVYVSEYREGAMLFELTREGKFTRYEMWFSPERNAFVLFVVDSHHVQVGTHGGETAILAGERHLLSLADEETILLHRVSFKRHHNNLSSIGEVLTK
jgi:hypothetical protein